MIQAAIENRYLEVGDKLVKRGKFQHAVRAYTRYADRCVAACYLSLAREQVGEDPLAALQALASAERLVGPSGEGREISAKAYELLGQREIASRFRAALAG